MKDVILVKAEGAVTTTTCSTASGIITEMIIDLWSAKGVEVIVTETVTTTIEGMTGHQSGAETPSCRNYTHN